MMVETILMGRRDAWFSEARPFSEYPEVNLCPLR